MFVRILLKQLKHKWAINLLLFLTIAALVSLYVFVLNTSRFSARSMQLIMKNMGLNQLVIPAAQSPADTYLCTDRQAEFPDAVTVQAAGCAELMSRYYVSMLQHRLDVAGGTVILSGIRPVARADETQEKGNPMKPVKPGTARLGSAAAAALGAQRDRPIELRGRSFAVSAVVPEQGTLDDCRVFLNLADLQALLGKRGKINVIQCFECLEAGGTLEEVHRCQRERLSALLPGFKLINVESIAQGRYYARRMTDKYQYCLLALVAAIAMLIVVITGFQEVAERKYETGILVAQGAGYAYIVGLYLAKTLGLSLLAAVSGFLIGGHASVLLTSPFLATNTREVTILWANLPPTIALVCLVALVAELLPMLKLVRLDPCAIVMEE